MSWFKFAADLLRDAMGTPEVQEQQERPSLPPANIDDLVAILNRHRAEIDRNFEAVAKVLAAQNAKHLHALQIQKRWNYALTAALVVVAIVAAVGLFRS